MSDRLSDEQREALAGVLAAHEPFGGYNFCTCTPVDDMGCSQPLSTTWEQHSADALAPLVAQMLADARAEALAPILALAETWERENAWGLGEQLASAIRIAAEASGREGER